jgi:hypothetical protein
MNIFQDEEYTHRVMAAVKLISEALAETEFDVATNALMTMLAQCGKQSTLTTDEFLIASVGQMKHLMDNMTVTEHPIQ